MKLTKLERAVTDTLDMYERLIADPHGVIQEWRDTECRVCKAMGKTYQACQACPLYPKNGLLCVCGDHKNEFLGSKMAIGLAAMTSEIRDAAKERYKTLLRRMKLNGWEYKCN